MVRSHEEKQIEPFTHWGETDWAVHSLRRNRPTPVVIVVVSRANGHRGLTISPKPGKTPFHMSSDVRYSCEPQMHKKCTVAAFLTQGSRYIRWPGEHSVQRKYTEVDWLTLAVTSGTKFFKSLKDEVMACSGGWAGRRPRASKPGASKECNYI